MKGLQANIWGGERILTMPVNTYGMDELLLQSREIVQKAIIDHHPYAVVLMLSGGDDSITALHVAIMLGVKIDLIVHGVTGTGLKAVRTYVHKVAELYGIKLIEANAGLNFENYIKRKGFFGVGARAHKYSYHILKDRPFRAAISKHLRKGVGGRRILLLNGVRVEESVNRADNYGDNPYRINDNNIWVNIIHWWPKVKCLLLLEAEGVQRSPVAMALGRSGECNCGTMQNEADRQACGEYEPEWWEWLMRIRKYCIVTFGFDINQNPSKKTLDEINAKADKLPDQMHMCVGCKARVFNQHTFDF